MPNTQIATTHGRFSLVDLGSSVDLRFAWIETVGETRRTLGAFYLFTDAIKLHASYEDLEARELPPAEDLAEPRANHPELFDAGENALALEERSEQIDATLDAAFERGQDAYCSGDDVDTEAARYFEHPRLQEAFREGWEDSASNDDDDSFCCSMDPSMRDTHGVPGRDL